MDTRIVLYVADISATHMDSICDLFDIRGFTAAPFNDGRAAIDFIEQGGEYDAVITDLSMPYCSGHDVLWSSARAHPEKPRFVRSCYDVRGWEEDHQLRLPPHHVIAPLTSMDTLCDILEDELR